MKKCLLHGWLLIFGLVAFMAKISAQTADPNNYAFTTVTNGNLTLDKNGNTVDMTTGTFQLIGPSSAGSGSGGYVFPFSNWKFMNQSITSFSVGTNGVLGLNTTTITGGNNLFGGASIRISPFTSGITGASTTSSSGKVHIKTIGTTPNRTCVIEWLNLGFGAASTTADATYQVRLYEATGDIEFVYQGVAIGSNSG